MIAMVVDGPLIEDSVGFFGFEELLKLFVVLAIDDGMAVSLACVEGASPEDFTGLFGFGNACEGWGWGPSAVVEVEEDDLMAELSEACDGAATSIFGVAGMAAGDDDLELAGGLGSEGGVGLGRGVRGSGAGEECWSYEGGS